MTKDITQTREFWDLQRRLMDLYGINRLTPVTTHAISGIAELVLGLVKPEAVDEWLNTPAPAFGDRSILDCVEVGDLDTPLGVLASLEGGGFS
jgi:hypothetical protein